MKNKKIIMLTGYKRSGKDTTANILKDSLNGEIFKFAEPLRQIVKDLLTIDDLILEEKKEEIPFKKNGKFLKYAGKDMSIRDLMIVFAEGLKAYYGKEIFCKYVEEEIKESNSEYCIISDLRYPFEAEYFKKRFKEVYVIKIIRKGIGLSSKHSSEVSVDKIIPDFLLNNDGSLKSLKRETEILIQNCILS